MNIEFSQIDGHAILKIASSGCAHKGLVAASTQQVWTCVNSYSGKGDGHA